MKVGDRVLLLYPAGDADTVDVVSLDGDGSSTFDTGTVRLPDGRIATTLLDNLVDLSVPWSPDPVPAGRAVRTLFPIRLADGRDLPAGSVGTVDSIGDPDDGHAGIPDARVRFPLDAVPGAFSSSVTLSIPADDLDPVS